MELTISHPRIGRPRAVALLVALALGASALLAFRGYIKPLSLPFLLGLTALPFSLTRDGEPGFRRWPLLLGTLLLLLTIWLPVRTLLFLGFGCLLACGAGLLGYRFRLLTLWNWILLSPMFEHMANAFSFPVRLQLAAVSGRLLAALSVPVAVRGNVIEDGRGVFSIDPGCMGLNMLVASLLLGVLLVGYYQQRSGRRLGVLSLALYVFLLLLLNVGCNLVRILLLLWFVWLPGTVLHEFTGLFCLALYVGLPAWWLARRWVRRAPGPVSAPLPVGARSGRRLFAVLCALYAVALLRVLCAEFNPEAPVPPQARLGAYKAREFQPGVLQLADGSHLVYVKFVRGFYDLEHNPTICWSGSGYSFADVQEEVMGGTRIYTARLVQGKESLYTAWWYGNGRTNTNRQWEWRRQMLAGAPRFAVVNVTASSRAACAAEAMRLLRGNTLAPLFQP